MTSFASQDRVSRRALSQREFVFDTVQRFGGLVATQTLHVEGPLQASSLRDALDEMQKHYALLNAHVTYGGLQATRELPFIWRRAYFDLAGTNGIPLRVISDAEPTDFDDILQSELATRVGGGHLPGMRVTLIQYRGGAVSDILFAANHAVADLPSQSRVSHDLLCQLAGMPVTGEGRQGPGLPPPLEDRYEVKPNRDGTRYLEAIRLPQLRGRKGRRTTPYLRLRLSADDTRLLKQAALVQKTSVHSVTAAAFLTAIGARFDMHDLTMLHSLELRRMCVPPLPARTFGCYIDLVRTAHHVDRPFWDLAREIKSTLFRILMKQDDSRSVLQMPDLGKLWTERHTLTNGLVDDCMSITAAGELPFMQHYGSLTLRDVTNLVSMNRSTTSFFVVVGEWNKSIGITLSYCSPIVGREDAEYVGEKALSVLKEQCAGIDAAQSGA